MGVIEDLTFQRDALIRKIKRINEIADSVEKDPKNKKMKNLLKVMGEHIDHHQVEFNDIIDKMQSYYNKQNPRLETTELETLMSEFDERYFNIKAILEALPSTQTNLNVSSSNAALSNTAGNSSSSVALPKLPLMTFDGDLKIWSQFKDLFEATVHNNGQIADIQKHMYLRSVLRGDALSVISVVPLTSDHYAEAWKILLNRYNDSYKLTDAYLQAIFDMPVVDKQPDSLRKFITHLAEYIAALKPIGHSVNDWSIPLLFVLRKKLTEELREKWQRQIRNGTVADLKNFQIFLNDEAVILEATKSTNLLGSATVSTASRKQFGKSKATMGNYKASAMVVKSKLNELKCFECNNPHELESCKEFLNLKPSDRLRRVKEWKLCICCLSAGHFVRMCRKGKSCSHCNSRHHALLHLEPKQPPVVDNNTLSGNKHTSQSEVRAVANQGSQTFVTHSVNKVFSNVRSSVVLLSTVRTEVRDNQGNYQSVKILLDSASTESLITRQCMTRLGLVAHETNSLPIYGLSDTQLEVANEITSCEVETPNSSSLKITALIVHKITATNQIKNSYWAHIQGLDLADPEFFSSEEVDILLGAEYFPYILTGRKVIGPVGTPSALETVWGYCLMGKVAEESSSISSTLCTFSNANLEELVKRFWAVEEPPAMTKKLSESEIACEDIYKSTVGRLNTGKYVVELPFKEAPDLLNDSREIALKRFLLLERRLLKNPTLRQLYNEFMEDYQNQKHMVLVPEPVDKTKNHFYIPHHCISRMSEDGSISKFRVVFDASMKTENGPSLNEILHIGPSLQLDISSLLLRFRAHEIAIVCDIRQMYRNILLNEKHHDFQRIFWRADSREELKEYTLTTVSYGVSSSPFLAIRTLHQLVADEGEMFPAASEALLLSTYMDDVVTSVPSVEAAEQLQSELTELLSKGQFELRKWASNHQAILANLPPEHCAIEAKDFTSESDKSTKILGFQWNPIGDYLFYRVKVPSNLATKRNILSTLAQIFDPLGYLTPFMLTVKCIIQYLWQSGCDWDEVATVEVVKKWEFICKQLPLLEKLNIPRCLNFQLCENIQLHGFADSSERGYAGVIYLRASLNDGSIVCSILRAKAKVAPLKRITLPRLELCAVVLVTRLLKEVQEVLSKIINIDCISAWTDSTVALSWVHSSPHRWATFVANRVSQVQEHLLAEQLRYVPTECNPADCASRGLLPNELTNNSLWWKGPDWLEKPPECWPIQTNCNDAEKSQQIEAEVRKITLVTQRTQPSHEFLLLNKFSSLTVLKRVTAWVRRFIHNCRNRVTKCTGPLSTEELNGAMLSIIKLVQKEEFSDAIVAIQSNKRSLPKGLEQLNPFIDSTGLLRVGGRLRNASLSDSNKYPLLLPKTHHVTNLIIDHYHKLYLHPGPSNLQAVIQSQFWILRARDIIRKRTIKCMECFRVKPSGQQPLMGDLPLARLQGIKAFLNTGVDYGGPFDITLGRLRKARIHKAYICLFICLATRAVHLELVSELSTDAFLAAMKRFLARRGTVHNMHSDCGTNFVGASRKLSQWYELTKAAKFNEDISREMCNRGIKWIFNPPAAPHWGGIWEAGIKSTKRLLKATVGSQILTYEEFSTVLTQIEWILNSRPLVPISSDPRDLNVLTPGHFVLMESPKVWPEPEESIEPVNLKNRWSLLKKIVSSFWKRWQLEYISSLQTRSKWYKKTSNMDVGSMVVLKESNLPPLHWRIGRITKVFPGQDGTVRVVEVQTSKGILTRAVNRVCLLPIEDD